jgi:hypothetical protein
MESIKLSELKNYTSNHECAVEVYDCVDIHTPQYIIDVDIDGLMYSVNISWNEIEAYIIANNETTFRHIDNESTLCILETDAQGNTSYSTPIFEWFNDFKYSILQEVIKLNTK